MKKPSENFDRPIPGMSMTAELGGRPWQSPPKYSTVEEAIDYYTTRMATDAFESQLFDVLELGVPVTTIVEVTQMNGVMEGLHTVDVGILISPVLMEFIMLVADSAGIDYNTGMEAEEMDGLRPAQVSKALSKFAKETDKDASEDTSVELAVEEMPVEEITGLMARRT